jgi:hypothetical protein
MFIYLAGMIITAVVEFVWVGFKFPYLQDEDIGPMVLAVILVALMWPLSLPIVFMYCVGGLIRIIFFEKDG